MIDFHNQYLINRKIIKCFNIKYVKVKKLNEKTYISSHTRKFFFDFLLTCVNLPERETVTGGGGARAPVSPPGSATAVEYIQKNFHLNNKSICISFSHCYDGSK